MCGIAGLWSGNPASLPRVSEVEAMIATLRHRGPDGYGVHVDGCIGLGHARLSIIDLDGGAQPLANEDGSIWVSFNGEIFNYLELRGELLKQGHQFRTVSDTEVLVHLYEQHGDAFVEHLNGQFAIALWDGRRKRLVLACDRVGIRPLFYSWAHGRLAFASEVKALFALSDVPRRLDMSALASLFSYWSVLPPASVFEGISSVPAGHMLIVDANGARLSRYWDWNFGAEPAVASDEEAIEELRSLLIDAVRLQLRADVPVGAYLSGGLDSSMVTAIVRKHTASKLRTFSLTFDDPEFDESAFQRQVVEHLSTEHSAKRVDRAAIGAAFPRAVWHAEVPMLRTAPVPMMLLADSVRGAGYKVVLTGEGADEALGGYDLFKEASVRRFVSRAAQSRWRGSLFTRLYPYLAHSPVVARGLAQQFFVGGRDDAINAPWFAHLPRLSVTRRILQFFNDDWRERLMAWDPEQSLSAILPQDFARWRPLERDQYVEAHTLMSGYLLSTQGDRVAMAASVEARYPFLDHRLIEFSCRLPPRLKLRGLKEKVLLKRVASSMLPEAITRRTKQPYRSPDSASFFINGRPLPYVAEILSAQSLKRVGMFDAAAVGRLIDKCSAGRAIGFGDNMAFVGILSTMLLHDQYIQPRRPSTTIH